MMQGKLKFDFLTSASNNFSKNYISGSMLSFHFCSDPRISMYTLHLPPFWPRFPCLHYAYLSAVKLFFYKNFFAKYSMVICGKLIFCWEHRKNYVVKVLLVPKCHYDVNCFRMETRLNALSMLQIKWTCFTATQWVNFFGAVLKSPFHLIQFSAASTCLASYQLTYIARIRHSFSQVNYTVFIPCNHERAWLF